MEQPKQKLPLTIVTAVLNEEKNLPQFLDYVTRIAQEIIVVVDYRTNDASAQIAKKYGCRVLIDTGQSNGIVFKNKNWGIKQASNSWVLILDADERMDETMEKEIKSITTTDPDTEVFMYQTGFVNIEFGQRFDKCDQKHKKFVRLFRKGSFEYETEKTAEGFGIHTKGIGNSWMLKIPGLRTWKINQNPKIKNLKGFIIHNSHPTVADFIKKINLYSTREAKVLLKSGRQSDLKFLFKLFFNPSREFIQKYFVWKMYKEGVNGAIASILYSFYHFLIMAKYLQFKSKLG